MWPFNECYSMNSLYTPGVVASKDAIESELICHSHSQVPTYVFVIKTALKSLYNPRMLLRTGVKILLNKGHILGGGISKG